MLGGFVAAQLGLVPVRPARLAADLVLVAAMVVAASPIEAASARRLAGKVDHSCVVTSTGGIQCWGDNAYGQLGDGTTTDRAIPVEVVGLDAVATDVVVGSGFTCALTEGGRVKCWGRNAHGELGDLTTTDRATPAFIPSFSGVARLAAGYFHACALTTVGGLKCWGDNSYGEVGDGTTTTPRTSPVDVSGLSTGVASVALGAYHSCAVTVGGGAKCWGYNATGAVGDGTLTNPRTSPVDVSGLTSGVLAVAPGLYFTCALTSASGVKCWGDNPYGQLGDGTTTDRLTSVDVSGLTSGVAWLGAGFYHACAVLSAGGMKCWGNNAYGRLGDGTTTHRSTPVDVSGLSSGMANVGSGAGHSCALTATGGVKCWGWNSTNQLGDGSATDRWTPVDVTGLSGGETPATTASARMSAGFDTSCAIDQGGALRCWGGNDYGQVGDGTQVFATSPLSVVGLASGVRAVANGGGFTCAVTNEGGVKCWGANTFGQLGDGTTTSRRVPADVTGLTSGVASVTAGHRHACAVTSAGAAKCWGDNAEGQLGDGTTTNRQTPVTVSGFASGARSISAGDEFTCLVTTAGGARCWGTNTYGQLGDGTTTPRLTSTWVSGLTMGVAEVTAGLVSACALTTAGGAKCWGRNSAGQLGDGSLTDRHSPVDVSGLGGGVSALVAGGIHACAIITGGAPRCWGDGYYGQIGDGTTSSRTVPTRVSGLSAGVAAMATGDSHTCAIVAGGGVQCWGSNGSGELGDGTLSDRRVPGWTRGMVSGQGQLAGGSSHTCRVTSTGGAQCWGYNSSGQLGDGSTASRSTPVDVSGLTSGVVMVGAGSEFSCALTHAGGVKCWGRNNYGQLGDGTTTSRSTPVDVTGLTRGVAELAVGILHACARTTTGGVTCWGFNDYGQLGDGSTASRATPAWVSGLTNGVGGLAPGWYHTCALMAGGSVKCWGYNLNGALGDGTTSTRATPVSVTGLSIAALAVTAGNLHSCALVVNGGVKCWGRNGEGQLGDGTTTHRPTPVDVSGLSGVVSVLAAYRSTCALTIAGGVKCWGMNAEGQLGDGTTTMRSTPVNVSGLTAGAASLAGGTFHTCVVTNAGGAKCWGDNTSGELGDGTRVDRLTAVAVRGFKLDADFDGDTRADVAVYRPSTGTWFSLDSSTNNSSYKAIGWGIEAHGDTPVRGDFDGDGILDPTVYRPASGTWFILESHAFYTTWSYFGWGEATDIPVPADYDGDGRTDGAIYRPGDGRWYVRPSSGAAQWNLVFGQPGDIPLPGHYDSDGKADIAVYRPSTGSWFVLTSSSNYGSYLMVGWGVDSEGDTPVPGDYDGDGRVDPCVYRPGSGTWFILESRANYTTWQWFGWGGATDTPVPSDFDGDGTTDAAIYRPTEGRWYVRPSSGAAQWNVLFGEPGDLPLLRVR